MKNIILILFLLILVSCSSENENEIINSSFITDYNWRLSQFNLPQPVDLNQDGVKSFDMTKEFECLKNEVIEFKGERVEYIRQNFYLVKSGDKEHYECSDEDYRWNSGSFKMINKNTIQIDLDYYPGNPEFSVQLLYRDNMLIRTTTQNHPVSYDENTQTYIRELIEIEEIFVPE